MPNSLTSLRADLEAGCWHAGAFVISAELQIGAVGSHILRSLQGKTEARPLSGDPALGKTIFFGKGECSNCHTVWGEGRISGPGSLPLTAHPCRGMWFRRNCAGRPERGYAEGYRSAVLITGAGERLEGLIRNEDNFSVQFQARDGSFHFSKSLK